MSKPLYGRPAVLSPAASTGVTSLSPLGIHTPLRRWRTRAIALAAALVLGSAAWDVHALALGRIQVLSALGEPLRAEVDVPQVSAEEVETLKSSVGSPELFRALGVDYNQALAGTNVALQRRANGTYFLRVSSDRPINEPFLDVVLEASWATGRIVRDFTLLLDPPNLRPATTLAPQLSTSQAPRAAAAAPQPQAAAPAAAPVPAAATLLRRPSGDGGVANPMPARAAGVAAAPSSVTVQPGDTAGRIAEQYRPPAISLDQMLVALLRTNAEAFDGGNINRLRAGSVLALPDAQQAAATTPAEARQVLVAQSRDFNEFRRRLAQGAAETPQVDGPTRSATGRLQAEVQDRAPTAATPDRLTLSKSVVQGRGAALEEERVALQRAAQDNAARLAELNKNIAELNRLNAATAATAGVALGTTGAEVPPAANAASAAASTAPAASPAAPATQDTTAPATPAAAAPAGSAGSPAAATGSSAPAAPSLAPSVAVPALQPAASAASQPDASALLEQLTQEPLVPAAAGGVVALLLGLGFWRLRRRRKSSQVDSSFLESRLQPDSFFGASGGQRIDTAEGQQASASSMVYSPSQLDAAGDVDPVAEADVYLAYGRDLQAEEILKEALRSTPQRVAIHTKLLEIYARRRDVHAFELIAAEAHALTHGSGPEWQHICRMGQDVDPQNPLYEQRRGRGDTGGSGGGRSNAGTAAAAAAAPVLGTQYVATDEADESVELEGANDNLDLDLDIDLDFIRQHTGGGLGAAIAPGAPASTAAPADLTVAEPARQEASMLDFDDEPLEGLAARAALDAGPVPPLADSVEMILPSLELDAPQATVAMGRDEPTALMTQPMPTEPLDGMPEDASGSVALPLDQAMVFDLAELSLELDSELGDSRDPDSMAPSTLSTDTLVLDEDPLATKLALAQEFEAIGDSEGARSLAEEVVAEATGELLATAQSLLAKLG